MNAGGFDRYYEANFAKTLGDLSKALKRACTLPAAVAKALDEAKDRRNVLAHRFFRIREEAIQTKRWREVVVELEDHRAFFASADALLETFIAPIRNSHGMTPEWLERAAEAYAEAARRERPESDGSD